jgi:hypothetical protein
VTNYQWKREDRATTILHAAAGYPAIDGCVAYEGPCWLCGAMMVRGRLAKMPATFMDYDKAACPSATHICEACCFAMEERSVTLQERLDRDKPGCMRNYSHIVLRGEWLPLSKAQKRETYEALSQGPELAIIAVSGQKHLLIRAQPGRWQMEETAIIPEPDYLARMMATIQPLYDGGFNKAEIEMGHYLPRRIMRYGIEAWQAAESRIASWRGMALFELAVYLLQKGEDNGRNGYGGDAGLGDMAGNRSEVQDGEGAGHLGSVSDATPGRGRHDDGSGAVRQQCLL